MTETILLAPGANGTELTRMLARFGVNSLGLRVMSATEFAKFALMRSGIVLDASFLPRKQEAAVVDSFIRDVTYFASAGYADSEKIADALYNMRSLIPNQEFEQLHHILPKGEFPEKNNSLVVVYDRYLAALKAAKHIDTVGIIRKALEEAKPLECTVCTLQEYPLTPLEDALVSRLAGSRTESDLPALLKKDTRPLQNLRYTESYGSTNEVEAIFHYIVSHNIPFDQCLVAAADPAHYAQLFQDFSQVRGLPVTFGCGIPILNANPARLLKLLYDWYTTGYNGVDALGALLKSDALDQKKLSTTLKLENPRQLDRVIQLAGQLRLGFHKAENDRKLAAAAIAPENAACVQALAEELALGESKLIEKYALIRDGAIGRVDRSALSVICDALDSYAKYTGGSSLEMIIPQILQRSVCSENSREGALFVTGISGAMASMRKHLFLAGMSAANFPGTPRENYLLLDSDYLLFADKTTAPTSTNIIQRKKETLDHLLRLSSALGVQTHISYSSYDLAAMKEENPSSVLFDIFQKQHTEPVTLQQFKEAFSHVVYFGQQVSGDHTIGGAYVQGKEICFDEQEHSATACACQGSRAYSPTTIDKFFACPRKFFLTQVLGVQEPEEDDPFTVLSAAEQGTLAHTLMEALAKEALDRDSFLQRAEAAFDRALLSRPPIHKDSAAAEKKAFCRMMAKAYDTDPGNTVLASEEDQQFRHSSGLLLYGVPDRVEKTADGKGIIADYKTGRNIKHVPHDIHTCLQVVIYAYLLEQRGMSIDHCQYRYLRDGVMIPCRYDSAMKEALDAKLREFKNALDTGIFPTTDDENTCRYCALAGICGKENEKEDAE